MRKQQVPMVTRQFATATASLSAAFFFMAGFAVSQTLYAREQALSCDGMLIEGTCLDTSQAVPLVHHAISNN